MKFCENWKEKLNKFLKADVLAECGHQVDHENRVVLCVLNTAMVCLSFLLAFYILWRKQADYYHEHMCILYAAMFLILLFVSFYSKRDSGIRLSVLITVEYFAIGSCFAMNHIRWKGKYDGVLSSGWTCILLSGAPYPDVSDAGGSHMYIGSQQLFCQRVEICKT